MNRHYPATFVFFLCLLSLPTIACSQDTDGDGMPDDWEILYGLNPASTNDAGEDADADWLTNVQEYQNGCDPTNADTDADSLPDGWEVWYGYSATDSSGGLNEIGLQRRGQYVTANEAWGLHVDSNLVFLADGEGGLLVIDTTEPTNCLQLGQCDAIGEARGVHVSGGHAYVAAMDSGLQVIDVTTPTNCVRVGGYDTSGWANDVQADGDYAYVIDQKFAGSEGDGLVVLNISNPAVPTWEGNYFEGAFSPRGLDLSGGYAYLVKLSSQPDALLVIDITDATNPALRGTAGLVADGRDIDVEGGYAFVADRNGWLHVLDLGSATNPVPVAACPVNGQPLGVCVRDGYAYVSAGLGGLQVFDVTTPTNPVWVGSCETEDWAARVRVLSNMVYVADRAGGLVLIENTGLVDADRDGMRDAWEIANFGDTNEPANADFDEDGISNWGEFVCNMNPTNDDQDADGLVDGMETSTYKSSPFSQDSDADGILDSEEVVAGSDGYVTDPSRADSDSDGIGDWLEMDLGRNPTNAADSGGVSTLAGTVRCSGEGLPNNVVLAKGASGTVYGSGATSSSGAYSMDLIPGTYVLKVEAEGWQDVWYSNATHRAGATGYVLPPDTVIGGLDFNLNPGQSPALVYVDSVPTGAVVYVDYQLTTNVTPVTIDIGEAASHALRVASHTLTVKRADGCMPPPQQVGVVEGDTVAVSFDLTLTATGSIQVVTLPAGADVFIDYADANVGSTPVTLGGFAPGCHTVLLRKDGYLQPRPIVACVEAESTTYVTNVALAPIGAGTNVTVEVASVPPGADLYVDYLTTTSVTDCVVDWLDAQGFEEPGCWYSVSHTILLRKEDYLPPPPRWVDAGQTTGQSVRVFLIGASDGGTDLDSDGLLDAWELAYGVNTNSGTGDDGPDGDPDNDGYSNWQEMMAGTNPQDGGSLIAIYDVTAPSTTFVVKWASVAGRRYVVQRTENLKAGSWVNRSGIITATSSQSSFEDAIASEVKTYCYRIVVLPQ